MKNTNKTVYRSIAWLALATVVMVSCQREVRQETAPGKPMTKVEMDVFAPGSDEAVTFLADKDFKAWTSIGSLEDRFTACEVPQASLENMTTAALVKSIFRYPLNYIIFAYDEPLNAVKIVVDNSPLHKELLQREDAGLVLAKCFAASDLEYADEMFVEYFIAYCHQSWQEDEGARSVLSEAVKRKFEVRAADEEKYSVYSLMPLYSIGEFLDEPLMASASTSTTTIYTPFVQALEAQILTDMTTLEKTNVNSVYVSQYPNATFLSTSTTKYNCHSYAWYNQNPNNNSIWLTSLNHNVVFQLSKYWTNDLYRATTADSAKVVFYGRTEDHSAMTSTTSGKYVSKWGAGPLMEHSPDDCPYSSSDLSFYVEDPYQHQGQSQFPRYDQQMISGEEGILINTTHTYTANANYRHLTLVWSAEPLPGIPAGQSINVVNPYTCTFTANEYGAYHLILKGYYEGMYVVFQEKLIVVYGN